MSQIKPNFIIVGVARCGTTSLYYYLKQHPDIGFPTIKEPKYFSGIHLSLPHQGPGDETAYKNGISNKEDYFKLFEGLGNKKAIGEASSDYLYYHQYTADAIKKEFGDIKIIIALRNPVERAYSAYNNTIRDGRETLSFEDALNAEEERLSKNWDWMWAYKKGGLYYEQVKHFKDLFSNVKVVLFEDIENNIDQVMKDLFVFLEVDQTPIVNTETKYSHSGKPKNALVALLTDRKNPIVFFFRNLVIKTIPRSILEKIAGGMFKKEEIPTQLKKSLLNYFREDITKLEKLINRDLSNWK